MCGISAKDWNTMLMSLRRSARNCPLVRLLMSVPSTRMRPAEGSINRLSRRTSVDLPEPDKPMTTKISPASMVKVASNTPIELPVRSRISCLLQPWRTSSSACCGASPKILNTWSMVIFLATLVDLPR